ncbi:elongation of very long chain fatty acids protein 4-like [Zootermopsis nevadensis]|uniref:Elongation of very long chain fatty acids protein n=1 Tax=Zootermopsis nevadensis TaxID=136037 RepID=A0A067RPN2_ZOONE|nr:elongation of very long chain fatty acids protein 4-like [Zootermopsis nevadensis]KDR21659.1 Elongation of very long chain fatty acids protein 4 [Zootermopsis nevadensis]
MRPTEMNIFHDLKCNTRISFVLQAVTDGLILHLFTESCKPQQGSRDHANKALSFSWWYVMSKVVELADTVFFVLRKKNRQVSFLHVYHHASQVVYSWACLKYLPGEQGVVMGFINSLVHVVMYFYYMVAAMGPKYQKYIWWKKYMTVIQLVQFVVALVYLAFTLVSDCHVSRLLSVLLATNGTFLLSLFMNFYFQTYKKKVAD